MKSYQNQSKHTAWDFAVTQSSLSKSFLRTQFIFLYSLILQSKSKDKILINIQLKRNSNEISNLRCTILSFSTFAWFFVYNQGDSTLFLKCYTKSLKSCLWTAIQYIMLTSPLFTWVLESHCYMRGPLWPRSSCGMALNDQKFAFIWKFRSFPFHRHKK